MFSDEKGQGALEVLLILAAAVLMAAVVGLYLKGLPKGEIAHKVSNVTNEVVGNIGGL